jgi:hypothetical protein
MDIPEAGIVDSKLFIRIQDMKHQFDLQMVEIFGLIDIELMKRPEISSLDFTGELAELQYMQ